jgi:glutamate 5-kinase
VEFRGPEGEPLGVGLVNYSAADIRRVMGLRSQHIRQVLGHKSYDEVVHRDNLVITAIDEVQEA